VLAGDVVSGHGPETVSIDAVSGVYTVAVHQYSDVGDFSGSAAVVEIAWGRRFERSRSSFKIPAGAGRWWYVAYLDIKTGEISIINDRKDHAPTKRK